MINTRIKILFCLCLMSASAFSQDKTKLQKQFTELLLAYPAKFENVTTQVDGAGVVMKVPGTAKAQVMAMISNIILPKGMDIVDVFEKWEDLIKSIELNGIKLKPAPITTSSFWKLKTLWKLDESKNALDPKYKNFYISLGLISVEGKNSISIVFGDKD